MHDQVALVVKRIQSARGVGDDQELATQLLHDADRESDLPGRITFVKMKSPFHRHDRLAGKLATNQLPLVAFDRRPWKKGNFRIGDLGLGLDLARQGAQSRAEDQADSRRATSIANEPSWWLPERAPIHDVS